MTVYFTCPDSLAEAFGGAIIWIILFCITYYLTRRRRLPWRYALLGLFFITGTTYVATLGTRNLSGEESRPSQSHTFAARTGLLGLLTFAMGAFLLLGSVMLLMTVASIWLPITVYVNGKEAAEIGEKGPGIMISTYFVALGVFHFVVTRRRVRQIIRRIQKPQAS